MIEAPGKACIINLALPTAGVEYSVALPSYTTHLTIQARGKSSVKVCFTAGESNTNYFTIKYGGCYSDQFIRAAQRIYAQSTQDGETLEIIAWVNPS